MLLLRSSARLVGVATALFIASSLLTAKATDGDAVGSGTGDADEATPDDTPQYECKDMEENCSAWSKYIVKDGHTMCEHNSAYMTQYCPVSCNKCDMHEFGYRLSKQVEGGLSIIPFCQDNHIDCRKYAEAGECDSNAKYMKQMCEASCGLCSEEANEFGVNQKLIGTLDELKKTNKAIEASIEYRKKIKDDPIYKDILERCLNFEPRCSFWAGQGECQKNESYMAYKCGPACGACSAHLDEPKAEDASPATDEL